MNPNTNLHSLETTWPASTRRPEPNHAPRPLVTRVFGRSDVGRQRAENQDRFLIASPVSTLWRRKSEPQGSVPFADIDGELFVVADGMGGHAGGAEASTLAVEAVEASFLSTLRGLFAMGGEGASHAEMLDQMTAALRSADARVSAEAARSPDKHDMGTTLTMAYRCSAWLFVVHAGDSRCYLLRGDTLHRVTRDHTLVSEMVRRGVLCAEEAEHHELRHVVTNAVGGAVPGVRSEGHRLRLEPHEVMLLCTDGLTEMVTDHEIRHTLQSERDPRRACDELIAMANERGGVDNTTVVVARFEVAGSPEIN